jgi:hypothetical protein
MCRGTCAGSGTRPGAARGHLAVGARRHGNLELMATDRAWFPTFGFGPAEVRSEIWGNDGSSAAPRAHRRADQAARGARCRAGRAALHDCDAAHGCERGSATASRTYACSASFPGRTRLDLLGVSTASARRRYRRVGRAQLWAIHLSRLTEAAAARRRRRRSDRRVRDLCSRRSGGDGRRRLPRTGGPRRDGVVALPDYQAWLVSSRAAGASVALPPPPGAPSSVFPWFGSAGLTLLFAAAIGWRSRS